MLFEKTLGFYTFKERQLAFRSFLTGANDVVVFGDLLFQKGRHQIQSLDDVGMRERVVDLSAFSSGCDQTLIPENV